MLKKSKFSLLLVLTLVVSMFLAACGNGSNKKEEAKTSNAAQEIKVLSDAEIPTMDSVKVTDHVGITYLNAVNEGLYTLDQKGNPTPAIADGEPKVSEDGTVYTFTLKDTKWSNGDSVTANDFVFAWQRAIDPKTASEYGPYMMNGKIKGAQEISDAAAANKKYDLNTLGVKAIDDKTLEVTFAKPLAYWDALLSFATFYPQNQKFVEEKGDKYATSADNLLYNGPFVMTKWDGPTSTEWILEKNPNYREADTVKLEKFTTNVVKDYNAQVNAFESGEVDITAKLASDLVPQYQGDERLLSTLTPFTYWIKMNEKNKALANVHIREAIAKAFDKDAMVKNILNDGSQTANYFIPKDFVSYEGKDFRSKYPDLIKYNVDEAKAAWDKGLKELGVKEISLGFIGDDIEGTKKVNEYIKNQLETNLPGLKIELQSVPFATRIDRTKNMDYDLASSGWGPDYKDALTFADLFLTGGPINEMNYSNPEYDKLINKAQNELANDPAAYAEAMQDAENILLAKDYALTPTYQRSSNILVNTKVKGLVYNSFGPDYSYRWITVE